MARFPTTPVSLRDANKLATTNMHNELANALNALQPSSVTGQQRPITFPDFDFLAYITGVGGADDFTDERYNFEPLFIKEGKTTDLLDTALDVYFMGDQATATTVLTNTAEQVGITPGNGTHFLRQAQLVPVKMWVDVGGTVRFTTHVPVSEVMPVTCTVDGGSNGTNASAPSYTYSIARVGAGTINTKQTPKNKRPIGAVLSADFGYAHYDVGTSKYVLGLCNEAPDAGACT
jgi:hypothetical protein